MKTELTNKVTRSLHKVAFKFKKHSPEILAVAGVVGIGVSAVMACKATLKVNEIIDEAKETVDKIHEGVAGDYHTEDGEQYTQEVANRDLAVIYVQTGWKFVKLYGPSVALGVVSVGCMLGSNHILRKRNIALAAAYKAVDTSFKEYRGRVIDRFGKELDKELRFNIKAKEIEEKSVDENGHEIVEKKTVEVMDPNVLHSIYSVVFDDGNLGWTKNAELNKVFLIQQQNYANDKLKAKGFLTLNEVYEMIGAKQTSFGQIAGWVWTEDGTIGDNFVDFGIFDIYNPNARDFVNGYEKTIILDFNCMGNILEYI